MIDDEDMLHLAHEWGRQRDATIEGKQMLWLVAEVRRLRAELATVTKLQGRSSVTALDVLATAPAATLAVPVLPTDPDAERRIEALLAEQRDAKRIYPCDRCGVMRSKAEGGTTFTVCDACWDAHIAKPTPDAKCVTCNGDGRLLAGNSVWPCTGCGGTGVRR